MLLNKRFFENAQHGRLDFSIHFYVDELMNSLITERLYTGTLNRNSLLRVCRRASYPTILPYGFLP
ncbi:hypothetical protein D3C74_172860 [compost metagenome]